VANIIEAYKKAGVVCVLDCDLCEAINSAPELRRCYSNGFWDNLAVKVLLACIGLVAGLTLGIILAVRIWG